MSDATFEETQRAVAGLFPSFARCEVVQVSDRCAPLRREEEESLANRAVIRAEFTCGRACAHAAVRALGVADSPIVLSDSREPVWPQGVVGSISHTRALAGAVACRSIDARAVGLRLEPTDAPMNDSVLRLLLGPDEIAHLNDLRSVEERAPALILSAKEAAHEITAPLWEYRLRLQSVQILVDLDSSRFTATIRLPLGASAVQSGLADAFMTPGDTSGLELRGAFAFVDDHVATGICIRQPKYPY